MAREEADELQRIIEHAQQWPIWGADNIAGTAGLGGGGLYAQAGQYGASLRDIGLWVALRESDREQLKSIISWDSEREMKVDPLAERIANAYSDLLYGENPDFVAADEADQDKLDEMLEANGFVSELRRWVGECVSEGEVWWRVYVDKNVSDWPIIESNSRLDVIPYFLGRRIAAAAFITDITSQQVRIENDTQTVIYRLVEIQTDGLVRNTLYKGTNQGLGDKVKLTDLPETQDLPDEWEHKLKIMLCGRVVNKLGRDFRLGISEFQGVKDLLLDLNEAHTTMAENARLTSKARMVVPANALDEEGKFDPNTDVIVQESMDDSLDQTGKGGPYVVLEYMFQAKPLLEYMDNLVQVILTRVGLAEQFIGGGKANSGQAFTGTALRTRLIPTTLAATGKGRYWDNEVPRMVQALQMVSALPSEQLGTGQSWTNADALPEQRRSNVLPEDLNEETQRHVMAVQGEIESIETAVRGLHPDAEDDWIEEEIKRIRDDRAVGGIVAEEAGLNTPPSAPGGGPGSAVPTPKSLGGTTGARPGRGQSPGTTPPIVKAGGPK